MGAVVVMAAGATAESVVLRRAAPGCPRPRRCCCDIRAAIGARSSSPSHLSCQLAPCNHSHAGNLSEKESINTICLSEKDPDIASNLSGQSFKSQATDRLLVDLPLPDRTARIGAACHGAAVSRAERGSRADLAHVHRTLDARGVCWPGVGLAGLPHVKRTPAGQQEQSREEAMPGTSS